jgi:hypothetical protein
VKDIDEEEADADDNRDRGGDQREVSNTTITNESQNMEVNNEAAEEIVEENLDTQGKTKKKNSRRTTGAKGYYFLAISRAIFQLTPSSQ